MKRPLTFSMAGSPRWNEASVVSLAPTVSYLTNSRR